MLQPIIFYLFASIAIVTATMVVISKRPVHAALFLVITFIASAGLWILLQAEFLGLVLILVYVGAVMTLFLFVVMMLNLDEANLHSGFVRYLPFALIVLALMLAMIIVAVSHTHFSQSDSINQPGSYSNVVALGSVLYTQYAYPFILAGALLLLSIIAAISLTFRGSRNCKKQRIDLQVAADPTTRVYMVNASPQQPSSTRRKQ